ncbi:hypothetical protein FJZ31_29820 [Candidatus Poribacteria bacterium]|nr:hypothetical protein [Candidatus Poribacteria bacterium]
MNFTTKSQRTHFFVEINNRADVLQQAFRTKRVSAYIEVIEEFNSTLRGDAEELRKAFKIEY